MTTNNTSIRYIVVGISTPKGMNGIPQAANRIVEVLSQEMGRDVDAVLVPAADVQEIYQQAIDKRNGSIPEGARVIHNDIRKNLESLCSKFGGLTWFPNLDAVLDKVGGISKFFYEGKPRFTFSGEGYTYYMNNALFYQDAFVNDDGQQETIEVNGDSFVLYQYSFIFKPKEGTATLEELTDDYDTLLEAVKTEFSLCGGWGIPGLGICYNEEGEFWYDLKNIRMSIEGNTVHVLAPHINEYPNTLSDIQAAKLAWDKEQRGASKPVAKAQQARRTFK